MLGAKTRMSKKCKKEQKAEQNRVYLFLTERCSDRPGNMLSTGNKCSV